MKLKFLPPIITAEQTSNQINYFYHQASNKEQECIFKQYGLKANHKNISVYDCKNEEYKILKCSENLYNAIKDVNSYITCKNTDFIISISSKMVSNNWLQRIFKIAKKFIFKITGKKYFENKDYLVYLNKNRRSCHPEKN